MLKTKEEYMKLWDVPLEELKDMALKVKEEFKGKDFHLCTIVNGKSGKCPEDCKYCGQSAWHNVCCEEYPLMDTEALTEDAMKITGRGIARYAVVTAGKRMTADEIESLSGSFKSLRENPEIDMQLCASNGLLNYDELVKLKEGGITRYHNNLEASRNFFPSICTTHTYDQKLETIKAAKKAGLTVCSGGIIGLGESREHRVDLAMELRGLGVDSVPLNILSPIPGTPLEGNGILDEEEITRSYCIFRIILQDISLRMAGGRAALKDKGRELFRVAVDAAITGDMLTTAGVTIATDLQMLEELGLHPIND